MFIFLRFYPFSCSYIHFNSTVQYVCRKCKINTVSHVNASFQGACTLTFLFLKKTAVGIILSLSQFIYLVISSLLARSAVHTGFPGQPSSLLIHFRQPLNLISRRQFNVILNRWCNWHSNGLGWVSSWYTGWDGGIVENGVSLLNLLHLLDDGICR